MTTLFLSSLVCFGIYKYFLEPGPIITCLSDQPLIQSETELYSVENFTQLQSDFFQDERWKCGQYDLNDSGKKGTTNFVLRFNNEGIGELGSEVFHNFFEKVRIPEANAFVLTVLVCAPSEKNQDERKSGKVEVANKIHRSESVGINSTKSFVAHQVNMFYVARPKYMEGGELHVFPPGSKPNKPSDMTKAEVIQPLENTLVTFRGDAWYRIMVHQTLDQTFQIISIILEQYIIPEKEYNKTVKFEHVLPKYETVKIPSPTNFYTIAGILIVYTILQGIFKQ